MAILKAPSKERLESGIPSFPTSYRPLLEKLSTKYAESQSDVDKQRLLIAAQNKTKLKIPKPKINFDKMVKVSSSEPCLSKSSKKIDDKLDNSKLNPRLTRAVSAKNLLQGNDESGIPSVERRSYVSRIPRPSRSLPLPSASTAAQQANAALSAGASKNTTKRQSMSPARTSRKAIPKPQKTQEFSRNRQYAYSRKFSNKETSKTFQKYPTKNAAGEFQKLPKESAATTQKKRSISPKNGKSKECLFSAKKGLNKENVYASKKQPATKASTHFQKNQTQDSLVVPRKCEGKYNVRAPQKQSEITMLNMPKKLQCNDVLAAPTNCLSSDTSRPQKETSKATTSSRPSGIKAAFEIYMKRSRAASDSAACSETRIPLAAAPRWQLSKNGMNTPERRQSEDFTVFQKQNNRDSLVLQERSQIKDSSTCLQTNFGNSAVSPLQNHLDSKNPGSGSGEITDFELSLAKEQLSEELREIDAILEETDEEELERREKKRKKFQDSPNASKRLANDCKKYEADIKHKNKKNQSEGDFNERCLEMLKKVEKVKNVEDNEVVGSVVKNLFQLMDGWLVLLFLRFKLKSWLIQT